jgi:hypothetical protein
MKELALGGLYAEHVKVIVRNACGDGEIVAVGQLDARSTTVFGDDTGERVGARGESFIFRPTEGFRPLFPRDGREPDELFRLVDRQVAKRVGVQDAESCRAEANGEAQRRDGEDGDSRPPGQRPYGHAEIPNQNFHI